jgi:hypothetical protein
MSQKVASKGFSNAILIRTRLVVWVVVHEELDTHQGRTHSRMLLSGRYELSLPSVEISGVLYLMFWAWTSEYDRLVYSRENGRVDYISSCFRMVVFRTCDFELYHSLWIISKYKVRLCRCCEDVCRYIWCCRGVRPNAFICMITICG